MKPGITSDAVSPVIGVMLMLVVTIIIAAVVSAFSGGLAGSNQKAPQLSVIGTYSQSNGLSITHNGGDAINFKEISYYLRNGASWGASTHMQYKLNTSAFVNAQGNTQKTFLPGDTIYILPPYSNADWMQPNSGSATNWYNNSANIGKTIVLEMSDSTGRMIATNEFVITA